MINPFEIYQTYNAIKLHFTSNYDYFKYSGKTNVSQESFLKSKIKYYFIKLSRKYSNIQDLQDLFVSNFSSDPKTWIGDMTTDDNKPYQEWKKYKQSQSYSFKQEITSLFEKYSPRELISVNSTSLPIIISEWRQGAISLDTFCILIHLFGALKKWEDKIEDDLIYPEIKNKVIKYSPFLLKDINIDQYKKILLSVLEETGRV